MKKLLVGAMAAACALTLSVTAFAADDLPAPGCQGGACITNGVCDGTCDGTGACQNYDGCNYRQGCETQRTTARHHARRGHCGR